MPRLWNVHRTVQPDPEQHVGGIEPIRNCWPGPADPQQNQESHPLCPANLPPGR